MPAYSPLHIAGYEQGLIQSRLDFLLPNDGFPILENAYIFRERIRRKKGCKTIGRLRRELTNFVLPNTDGSATYSQDILNTFHSGSEPNAELQVGGITIKIAPGTGNETIYQDVTPSVMTRTNAGPYTISASSINYATGQLTLNFTVSPGAGTAVTGTFAYYPSLPVMGLRERDIDSINDEEYIQFDQVYAYRYVNDFIEYIPGTTWTGTDSDFFWSTNYWVDSVSNQKLFWVTNYSGPLGDPIRYTNGTTWTNFAPQINGAGDVLAQCLCIIPFRSRLVTFNTREGPALNTSIKYYNRIRWAAIGNPLAADAWRDDIRGKGGFLDIPTNQDIISVGFVRDNLVVYCERSTWQLRYTGKSIAPFQIEKVNSELGAESTFSSVQFDTSLVGVGDKGVVECDSFKSDRIDIKIPDLVFQFNNENDGVKRVHGIRDFIQKIAYWTYPYSPGSKTSGDKFPNRRLVFNYENKSWAIFTDSLTALGQFQETDSPTWASLALVASKKWSEQNWPWVTKLAKSPNIIGGNQQGFIEYLDYQVANDPTLTINNIIGSGASPPATTQIVSINHNLATGQFVILSGILELDPFFSLNDIVFQIDVVDKDTFKIFRYNQEIQAFNIPQTNSVGTYLGGGRIKVRDNFNITSKKFSFLDKGENIQLGFIDVLLNDTSNGAISLNVYLDYNDTSPVNAYPENTDSQTGRPDTFFNTIVPTTRISRVPTSKNWQRVFCAARGSFITLQWTFSISQMAGTEPDDDVEIDSQILWIRPAGKQLPLGI